MICAFTHMYIYTDCIHIYGHPESMYKRTYINMCLCILYIYVHIYIYRYIYIYVYMYMHMYKPRRMHLSICIICI